MEVLIGVDPHKATNVVAAVDEQGEALGQETFPANRKGMRALERWANGFPERRWAVEGAGGIGRPLAQKLLAGGEGVVDVPPKLSAKVRVLSSFAVASLATPARTTASMPPSPRWPPYETIGWPPSNPRTARRATPRS
jgi:transposase